MVGHVGLVRVDLDGEVLTCVEKLEQERKAALVRRRNGPEEGSAALCHDDAKRRPA